MKTEKRRNITGKALAILLAFTVAFTGMPALAGSLDAHAASSYFRNFSAKATGQTGVKLTWKKLTSKQKKKISGIAVYRNGKLIRHISKKRTSYADNGLKVGTKYRYQVKTYRIKTVKQWYNKKTGKWQKKKPAKMYRGKSRKNKTLVYSNASGKKTVTTAQAVSSDDNDGSTVLDGGDNDGDNGGSGGGNSGDENLSEYDRLTGATLSCTDYLGKTHTSYETASGYWTNFSWEGSGNKPSQQLAQKADIIESINSPYYNRTVDGEFTISGGTVMKQINGVTFKKEELTSPASKPYKNTSIGYSVSMYNGDPEKLVFDLQNPVESVSTYSDEFVPITRQFIMKDGYRLIDYYGVKQSVDPGNENLITKTVVFGSLKEDLSSCGFVSGNVTVKIKYDGTELGTIVFNPNSGANSNGLHPMRQFYLDAANAAVEANGGKKSYSDDWHAIRDYVAENFSYPPEGESGKGPEYIDCIGGARIFETYSVYVYGEYGFFAHPPESTNPDSHTAFYRDADPNGTKYETQGHH